jgi:CheY-like chemotaxis protein
MTSSNQSFQLSPKYRILCVDDDLFGLESRTALFEEEGYSVTSVSCPMMALAHDMSRFHLAVLDFDMPVLNGFQLSLRLRAARRNRCSLDSVNLDRIQWVYQPCRIWHRKVASKRYIQEGKQC